MKKDIIRTALVLVMTLAGMVYANAASWDFKSLGQADIDNLNADTENWTKDNNRWKFKPALTRGALTANGQEPNVTMGLRFTCNASGDSYRVGTSSDASHKAKCPGGHLIVVVGAIVNTVEVHMLMQQTFA